MPNFYVLASAIAIAAAILWASRQGKAPSGDAPADANPPHPMAWIGFSLLGVVLAIVGMVMCTQPGEPGGGGKGIGILLYLAYLLLGDYGPAIAALGAAAACLYKAYTLVRDDR
jgi:drug/metabolite transporter (DMT)-like permease